MNQASETESESSSDELLYAAPSLSLTGKPCIRAFNPVSHERVLRSIRNVDTLDTRAMALVGLKWSLPIQSRHSVPL